VLGMGNGLSDAGVAVGRGPGGSQCHGVETIGNLDGSIEGDLNLCRPGCTWMHLMYI